MIKLTKLIDSKTGKLVKISDPTANWSRRDAFVFRYEAYMLGESYGEILCGEEAGNRRQSRPKDPQGIVDYFKKNIFKSL